MSADRARTMPGTTYRNGMPPSGGYAYNGSGYDRLASPAQIAAQLRNQVRAKWAAQGLCIGCGNTPGSCAPACGGAQ